MNEFIDRILERPRAQKFALLTGVIVILGLLYAFLYYYPLSAQISEVQEQIENARVQQNKLRRRAANLPKLKKELQYSDRLLQEVVSQLPDRKEIPDLLRSISGKAREAGLEILIFRPRAENVHDFYAEIPVDIVVRGGFHSVLVFFDEVGRLTRLVNIQNIEIRTPQVINGRVSVQTSAQATTFRFLDEEERAKRAAEQKAKKKARRR